MVLRQVLLVDDNPSQLALREAILRGAGFHVAVATTADRGLATLRILGNSVGVVVTDHLMPGCTGSEFVRLLRAENDWVPVIALSGLPDADREYDGLNVVFRMKPLPPTELIALVRNFLSQVDRDYGAA
jgi:DNA-binding response OmpR family regulator